MSNGPARFMHYVDENLLPLNRIDVRECANHSAVLALASHAPSCGVHYEPIEDLIISVVLESQHSQVQRDVGSGTQRFVEAPGCILITPPHRPSYWYFESTPLVLHVTVSSEHAKAFITAHAAGRVDVLERLADQPVYDPLVSHLASRMWSALADASTDSEVFNTHALDTLLAILYCGPLASRANSATRRGALAPWRLKVVTTLMADRLDETLTVEEMANRVELSTDHFLRSFAAATGRTPHQWLTEMRIEKAKQFLRETQRSTTEIALDLGYSSPGHFSSRFRQLVGMTPTAWRRTFANNSRASCDQSLLQA